VKFNEIRAQHLLEMAALRVRQGFAFTAIG
jgi:hypothetical protein